MTDKYEILISPDISEAFRKYKPKPGAEIPGWYAAKLASEGRAAEVEWRRDTHFWRHLENDAPSGAAAYVGGDGYRFRLKSAPTKTLRPWRIEEVPLNAWYRKKREGQDADRYRITRTGLMTITLGTELNFFLDDLAEDCEHSHTGLDPWFPCGVEE